MRKIFIYDTTLRDGTQGDGINFTVEDKVKIATKLDDVGFDYIEGGWPGANPRDDAFFEKVSKRNFKNAKIVAFGSTRRPKTLAKENHLLQTLVASKVKVATIFGKSWDLHVKEIIKTDLEENLNMIRDSIAFLKSTDIKEVIYDAEHYFDAFKNNKDYALETIKKAAEAGASFVVLCDTNGGSLFYEISEIISETKKFFKKNKIQTNLGIHAHNDANMAVSNSIAAIDLGCSMVQGTINGYGERCGNADLTSIIPIIEIKMANKKCIGKKKLQEMTSLSRFVSDIANVVPLNSRPFVGQSAFSHKGGMHIDAVNKNPIAYEHIDPKILGNKRRILTSDLSGKNTIETKAKSFGFDLAKSNIKSSTLLEQIKLLEQDGFQFDVAEGSLKIIMAKMTNKLKDHFSLEKFRVNIEKEKDKPCYSYAMIKFSFLNNNPIITSEEGDGPIGALDNAMRKALEAIFPEIKEMKLVDFKVRVLDGTQGSSSKVQVLISSRDKEEIWNTVGASENIIEASWQALLDSFQYKILKDRTLKKKKV